MKKCLYCGYQNKDESSFCTNCGKQIKESSIFISELSPLIILGVILAAIAGIVIFINH